MKLWHSQLNSLVWKRRENKNRKYRMGHVTYLCIWQTFVEILILFVQRMFCNGKKNYTYGNSLKVGVSQQKIVFFLFFSVLIVIVHACLSREGDMLAILSEMEKKKETVAVSTKKDPWFRPLASKSFCWLCMLPGWVASPVHCVVMLAPRTLSNPVSSPVHQLLFDHLSICLHPRLG